MWSIFESVLFRSVGLQTRKGDSCGTVDDIGGVYLLEELLYSIEHFLSLLSMRESYIYSKCLSFFVAECEDDVVCIQILVDESTISTVKIHKKMVPNKSLLRGFVIVKTSRSRNTLLDMGIHRMYHIDSSQL